MCLPEYEDEARQLIERLNDCPRVYRTEMRRHPNLDIGVYAVLHLETSTIHRDVLHIIRQSDLTVTEIRTGHDEYPRTTLYCCPTEIVEEQFNEVD